MQKWWARVSFLLLQQSWRHFVVFIKFYSCFYVKEIIQVFCGGLVQSVEAQ